jgi:hypothetical protein
MRYIVPVIRSSRSWALQPGKIVDTHGMQTYYVADLLVTDHDPVLPS